MQTNFHLAAYSASITNGTTNSDVAAVLDTILTRVNSHFLVPKRCKIAWAYCFGVNASRFRLNTPSLRYVGLPSMVPVNITVAVPSPMALVDWTGKPLWVEPIDEIAVEATHSDAAPQIMAAILAFDFGREEPARGPTYTLRATATVTAAASTWVNGNITLDQSIPQGRYQVVGMRAVGTNLAAVRLVYPGASFRPGVIAQNTVGGVPHPIFEGDAMGNFGWFDFPNIPSIDVFANGANTSQEIFLDVVRIGNSSSYMAA